MLQLQADTKAFQQTSNEAEISANLAESLYDVALKRYENGKYQDAASCFQLLILSHPEKAKYWFALAASQQQLEQYRQAVLSYSVAARLEPVNPYTLMHMAECFFSLRHIKEGVDVLQKAMLLAKNYPNSQTLIIQIEALQMAWKPEK